MSISTNIPAGNYVNYSEYKPGTVTGRKPVRAGNILIQNLSVGNYVESSDGSFSKITAITVNENVTCKNINFKSGLQMKVDATSAVSPGDTITGEAGVDQVVESISDAGTDTCYTLTVEGGNSILSNGLVI